MRNAAIELEIQAEAELKAVPKEDPPPPQQRHNPPPSAGEDGKLANIPGHGELIEPNQDEIKQFLGETENSLCLNCVMSPCLCDLLKLEMKIEALKNRKIEVGVGGG